MPTCPADDVKVALWGSYGEGNYGDDLMALVFAEACSRAGAEVIAYRTPAVLTDTHGIARADTLDELLDRADLCVVGGGEFLFRNAPIKRLVRGYLRTFERSCSDLARHAARRSVPLAAISIGGDGTTTLRALSPHRRALFASPLLKYASVRLETDLAVLANTSAKVEYFPDALLATSAWSPQPRSARRGPLRLGINVHRPMGLALAPALRDALGSRTDVELTVIRSHLADSGHDYELSAEDLGGSADEHRYRDPHETTRFLAGLDVVISSKLHVGVVAMSYGAVFLSFGGKAKARAFMKAAKSPHVYGADAASEVAGAVARIARGEPARTAAETATLDGLRVAAAGHLRALEALVASP